ncbi:hypothetical protein N9N03_00985 [Chlamydiia bacterium]|nr:hypothetical protein [Chlamydiia bacterium]
MKMLISQQQSLTYERVIELVLPRVYKGHIPCVDYLLNETRRLTHSYSSDIALSIAMGLYHYLNEQYEHACYWYEDAVAKGGSDPMLGLLHALSGIYLTHYRQYSHHYLRCCNTNPNRLIRRVAKEFSEQNKNRRCLNDISNDIQLNHGGKYGRL